MFGRWKRIEEKLDTIIGLLTTDPAAIEKLRQQLKDSGSKLAAAVAKEQKGE